MPLKRRIGLGTLLDVDPAGGTTWQNVASVTDEISGPDGKAEIVPVPLLSELYKIKVKGELDGGQVTFSIAYDPDDDTTKLLGSLYRQRTPVPSWRITFEDAAADPEIFTAHLAGINRTVQKNGYLVSQITLDVSGDPGFATV